MSSRRKPTSVLLHEKERLQDAVFIACREGHIHDLKKLKPKLNAATEAYNKRIEEDKAEAMRKEQLQQEREAAREAKRLEKERKAEEQRLKKLEREAKRGK